MARDPTQPCNESGRAAYEIERGDGMTLALCCNHAARMCAEKNLPFPLIKETPWTTGS
jgi:hypothetical protein